MLWYVFVLKCDYTSFVAIRERSRKRAV